LSSSSPARALAAWQASPRGRRQLALEQRELAEVLPELFGRHLLQIGDWAPGQGLLNSAEMLHRAVLGAEPGDGVQAVIDFEQLPLMSRSVDAVLLPHTLEFVRSPHTLLREVARVLNDRGRLVVLGFNPWSLRTLGERLGMGRLPLPREGRRYGVGRLSDWLALLDMEISVVSRFGPGFPRRLSRRPGQRLTLRGLAAPLLPSYLLVANKRVIPVNRLRLPQRAQVRPLLGGAVSLPGARSEES